MKRTVHVGDLPAGMMTIGGALAGFLTELEERCTQQEGGNSALVQDRRRLSRAPESI
jgi:hypothetical protein